jgi:hypothetical protein
MGIAAIGYPAAKRAVEYSPRREPWVQQAKAKKPRRGVRNSREVARARKETRAE